MHSRYLVQGLIAGVIAGAGVAALMTFLDWRLNPGGLFHSAGVTNWPVVRETALSWAVPVFALVSVLATAVLLLLGRRS